MRPLTVSFGTVSPAVITAVKTLGWKSFSKWLTGEAHEAQDKAERGWYIPATFDSISCAGGSSGPCPLLSGALAHRDSDHFVSRDAITLDFDKVTIDTWGDVLFAFDHIAFAIYTTFSHTDLAPRFRVVVPLSRPAGYDEFQAVARKLAEKVGIELVARESFVPAQMMYSPTRKTLAPFISKVNDAPWLDVDATLAEYKDWTDVKTWPHRKD